MKIESIEKEMATYSSILAWRIPWTEEPGGLQSMGLQRVRLDWATNTKLLLGQCMLYVHLKIHVPFKFKISISRLLYYNLFFIHQSLPFHTSKCLLYLIPNVVLSLSNCAQKSFKGQCFRPGLIQDHLLHLVVLSVTSLLI